MDVSIRECRASDSEAAVARRGLYEKADYTLIPMARYFKAL